MKKKSVETKYAAMPGGVVSGKQAEIIGAELERVAKKHGCLKAAAVVTEARPKTSPLNPYFTWDDSEAAELYRQNEARVLIRSVRVVRVDIPYAEQPVVRAFLHVTATESETRFEGPGYLPLARVMSSKEYSQQVLDEAMRELREWKSRYEDYKTVFSAVFEAIESLQPA